MYNRENKKINSFIKENLKSITVFSKEILGLVDKMPGVSSRN